MVSSALAHSPPVGEDWSHAHLLEDHLRAVAELAAEHARPFPRCARWLPRWRWTTCCMRRGSFGAEDWAYSAGLWHDLGKYRSGFQRYLHDQGPSVSHKLADAAHAWRNPHPGTVSPDERALQNSRGGRQPKCHARTDDRHGIIEDEEAIACDTGAGHRAPVRHGPARSCRETDASQRRRRERPTSAGCPCRKECGGAGFPTGMTHACTQL